MARSVSLSDEAFAVLRHEKQVGESDSDVVLRLHRTAHRREKDPMAFFRNPPKPAFPPAKLEEFYRRMDEADRRRSVG